VKLSSGLESLSTIAAALFAVAIATSGLSASGCTNSSGAAGTGGAGGSAGVAGSAGEAGNGGAAAGVGGQAGGAAGAAGSIGSTIAACATTATPTSGIDPTTRLDALTLAQKAAYCDWAASRYCGYGHSVDCGDGNFLGGFVSQADCVDNMNNTVCASTIAESEACETQATCDDPFPDPCLAISTCQ